MRAPASRSPHPRSRLRRTRSTPLDSERRRTVNARGDRRRGSKPLGPLAGGPASLPGGRRRKKADQFTHGVVTVLGMTKWQFVVHFVPIAPSVTRLGQIASPLEVLDQLRGRSFRDADGLRDVPEAGTRVGSEAYEHMCVVGDEGPSMIAITGINSHER